MPRKYKRKPGVVPRHIHWTEESLALAFQELDKKQKGINEISRIYGISSRTLRRRYEKKNKQLLTQGKHPVLGFENEKILVAHILKLRDAGFSPKRSTICQLAYQFAEKIGLKHNFNNETKTAGPQWLKSFLERNPEIVLKQAEGLSIETAKDLNSAEVAKFFDLLTTILTENDFLDKPDKIFNMDETGIQLYNKPGKELAKKGARAANVLSSGEKAETITVIACCNAIGNFLPPVFISKGVNEKPKFKEGLPPCSKVYMQKKSAYISPDLFYKWLTEHFITHKPPGKVLLILDGHSSHSSVLNMLETARDNDVVLLCLPSHASSALPPFEISVFGPFKKYYCAETNNFMRTNPQKKVNQFNSGQLITKAWIRAATPANATRGFRGSGIYPVNPNALSDAEFAISDIALWELAQERDSGFLNDQIAGVSGEPALGERSQDPGQIFAPNEKDQVPSVSNQVSGVSVKTALRCDDACDRGLDLNQRNDVLPLGDQVPSGADKNKLETVLNEAEQNSVNQNCTLLMMSPSLLNLSQDGLVQVDIDIENYISDGTELSLPSLQSLNELQNLNLEKEIPSKFRHQPSPIPLSMPKRAKQSAEILNSNDLIVQKKSQKEKRKKNEQQPRKKKKAKKYIDITSSKTKSDNTDFIELNKSKRKASSKRKQIYSKNEENVITSETSKRKATKRLTIKNKKGEKSTRDTEKILKGKSAISEIDITNKKVSVSDYCAKCLENFNFTKWKSNWIQCEICRLWLHETCTTFKNHCMICGE